MRRLIRFRPTAIAALLAGVLSLGVAGVGPLEGQSLTVGGLTATIVDERGTPMRDVTVTVERSGVAVRTITTDRSGQFTLRILSPGRYSLLAEQLGFQPVRMRDVPIVAGGSTTVTIHLAHRPPPITTVDEQSSTATVVANASGRTVSGNQLEQFDRRRDITGVAEMFSDADVPRDGREGLVASANGLAPRFSSLYVDGVREALLRHPGIPSDPVTAPLFARDGADQVMFSTFGTDAEWPPTLGAVLTSQTTSGGDNFAFRPWFSVGSAKLGGKAIDNPGDSTATSFRGGFSMGGPIKRDTAAWLIRADYQRLQQPGSDPFRIGMAGSDSGDVRAGIIAHAPSPRADLATWVDPTVRTWKGGSGMAKIDWRFGSATLLAIRAGLASWSETNGQIGEDLTSGTGTRLNARDASGAIALTTGGEQVTSETRIGLRTSKRDWFNSALPYTGLAGDGLAFGTPFTLPGDFSDNGLDAYETITARFGAHTLKFGGSVEHDLLNYSWVPGSAGRYEFGDLASFQADRGAFYQATRSAPAPDLSTTNIGLFLEDTWHVTPQMQVFGGIRYDQDKLPTGVIALNNAWGLTSGLRNDLIPSDSGKKNRIGGRAGILWDASGNGRTVIRASGGIVPGRYDIAALAEAAQFDGDVHVRRATGTLAWPSIGDAVGDDVGATLTFFNSDVRKPRAYKLDLSLSQKLDGVTTLSVTGGYRHTDYLLQRHDLNLPQDAVSTGSDGRPIYGTLQQFGGLLTPAVGSNRRFTGFDMVYGLSSTGYTDYYEADVALERQLTRGLSAMLSYTYSRTTDNLPGQLSADPADALSPFPSGLNGAAWEDGKSDLDIPHRIAATLSWVSHAKSPLTLAARYRYRSGLPFTPGFRPGVDANGDGSGNNDPAFLGGTIPGMSTLTAANTCLGAQIGQLAARNSCREAGVHTLDLHASVALPGMHRLAVTVDAFNVVGSATGIVDRAAVLVDPKGSITTDASGHIVLPLVANPDFGQLLSRRGIPRQVRVGFRMED